LKNNNDYDDSDYIIDDSGRGINFTNVKGFYDVITNINRFICQARIERDYFSWLDGLDMYFVNTEPWWLEKDDIPKYEELYDASFKRIKSLNNSNGVNKSLIENRLLLDLRIIQRLINKNTKHLQLKESESEDEELDF
jgi:hypothetical protein